MQTNESDEDAGNQRHASSHPTDDHNKNYRSDTIENPLVSAALISDSREASANSSPSQPPSSTHSSPSNENIYDLYQIEKIKLKQQPHSNSTSNSDSKKALASENSDNNSSVTHDGLPLDDQLAQKWPCSVCTYLNWPKSLKCVQCYTLKQHNNNNIRYGFIQICRKSLQNHPRTIHEIFVNSTTMGIHFSIEININIRIKILNSAS